MAVTYSGILNTVVGNQRLVVFNLTATAAEEEVGTAYHGLETITGYLGHSKQSGVTHLGCICVQTNLDSSGVASIGCLGYSSLAGAASQVIQCAVLGV